MKRNMTNTNTPLLTAEELYDLLMGQIEPDLLTSNIAGLPEKYKGETDDERMVRMEHYAHAFDTLDGALIAYDAEMALQVNALKKDLQYRAEAKSNEEDVSAVENLESAFSSSDDGK